MYARLAIGVVLAVVVAYGFMEAGPLLRGPRLALDSPAPGAVSADGIIEVSGTAYRTESLSLNGGPLLIDSSGKFYEKLTLPSGGVILSLTARDRFGRTAHASRTVVIR